MSLRDSLLTFLFFNVRRQTTVNLQEEKKSYPFPQDRREHWNELNQHSSPQANWRLTLAWRSTGGGNHHIIPPPRQRCGPWPPRCSSSLRSSSRRRRTDRLKYLQTAADCKEEGMRLATHEGNSGSVLSYWTTNIGSFEEPKCVILVSLKICTGCTFKTN